MGRDRTVSLEANKSRGSSKQRVVARGHLVKGKMGRSCLYLEMRKLKVRSGKLSIAQAWGSGPVT